MTALLTLEDVAQQLQVTPRQLRRLRQGRDPLPVVHLSRKLARVRPAGISRPGSRDGCYLPSKTNTLPRMTGSELRRLRTAAGLTQKALAVRLELNPNYLASLERGEAPIRRVVALAVRSVTSAAPRRRTRGRHEV